MFWWRDDSKNFLFLSSLPHEMLKNSIFLFQSKTYDSVTDKYMDLSFEKTNSAYMLFYELVKPTDPETEEHNISNDSEISPPIKLSNELEGWIWQDNRQFLQDKNIFESAYFQ